MIAGAIIGWLASIVTNKNSNMGAIANIFAGLIGSSVGQVLLGTWGPSLAGMTIVPSVIGSVIVIAVVSFFFEKTK